MNYVYFNGKIIDARRASVRLNDLGLLRGYGVFEFLRTYNGQPFLLREHLKRFQNSARILNLRVPIGQKELVRVIKRLIAKNKLKDAAVKIILTGGPTADGITYSPAAAIFLFLKARPLSRRPETFCLALGAA